MKTERLLERLGKPFEEIVHLDFESYYSADYTLDKSTNEAYVRDPRFEVIGVGVQVGKGPRVWLEEWDFRAWAATVQWERVAVNAHHAQFDAFILSERYGIRPAFIFCTMSMGRALHGVGALEALGPMYQLGSKGDAIKSGSVKGKRRADLTQRQWREFGEYCKQDVAIGAGLLYAMAPQFPPLELWLIDTTVRMFTEPVFCADDQVLVKALVEERVKKAALIAKVVNWAVATELVEKPSPRSRKAPPTPEEITKTVLGSSDKFAKLLTSLGVEVPYKPSPSTGELIPAFSKDDPGMQHLLAYDREEIRDLAEARLSVKSNLVESRVERLINISKRGLVPFYLGYAKAHTHRWAGGDRLNVQNFNRGGALRDAILARPGEVLVVADSSQIEARVLPWFAGEKRLLETFRRNDALNAVYERAFAQAVEALGHEPSEAEAKAIAAALAERGITEGDFYSDEGKAYFLRPITKKDIERQLSKAMILGLGFEMGWGKFSGELLKGMLGSKPVQFTQVEATKFRVDVAEFEARPFGRREEGVTCGDRVKWLKKVRGIRLSYEALLTHCAVAAHFVVVYRTKNAAIAKLWRKCEDVLKVMAADGPDGVVRMRFGCLRVVRHGLIKPSGLVLRYPGLRKGPEGYTYLGGEGGHERTKIYGGLLTENIVQSLARDIVAEQAMEIRADGVKIGTTTHDEVVAVVPEARGAEVLASMLQHMRTPPEWCRDLPLNAAGGFGRSYGSVK